MGKSAGPLRRKGDGRTGAKMPEDDALPWGTAQRASARPGALEWLLDYEIRCASRYRRFTTVVMVASVRDSCNMRDRLGECRRASDAFFQTNGTAAILMGETDVLGALTAVNRYKDLCKEDSDLRFAVASYPTDVRAAPEMLATVQRRLRAAKALKEPGAVVSAG